MGQSNMKFSRTPGRPFCLVPSLFAAGTHFVMFQDSGHVPTLVILSQQLQAQLYLALLSCLF